MFLPPIEDNQKFPAMLLREGGEDKLKKRKRIKILNSKQTIDQTSSVTVLLVQIKAGNNSCKLKKQIYLVCMNI